MEDVASDTVVDTYNRDPWSAEAFIEDADPFLSEGQVTPDQLRALLNSILATERFQVDVSFPFFVYIFGGILVGLVYGSLLGILVPDALIDLALPEALSIL
jgi:hypothetical protein